MAKLIQELPAAGAVTPGQVATFRVPETAAYSKLLLKVKHTAGNAAMTKADQKTNIENVKLKVAPKGGGSTEIWDISGEEFIELNDFYQVATEDGILPLLFARPWLRDVPGLPDGRAEDRFALGTADLGNVTLEIKLASGVVNPDLKLFGEIYAEGNGPMGQIIKLDSKRGYNAAAAGKFEISDLPVVGPGMGMVGLHFKTANIDRAEVVANGTIIQDAEPDLMRVAQDNRAVFSGGRTWQTGRTHFEFAGNRYSDIIETSGFQDLRVKLDMSAASTFDVITETVIGRVQ